MQSGISTTRIDRSLQECFQRLRPELGVESFGLNLMRLAPGQRGRIHVHERQEEVYAVLEGTLTIELGEQEALVLERGGLARVAPEVRRRLVNRGADPVLLLAIGGHGPPHAGRDGIAYEAWDAADGRPPQEVALPPDLPEAERA